MYQKKISKALDSNLEPDRIGIIHLTGTHIFTSVLQGRSDVTFISISLEGRGQNLAEGPKNKFGDFKFNLGTLNVKQCIRAGGGGKTRFAGGAWPAFWSDTLLLD